MIAPVAESGPAPCERLIDLVDRLIDRGIAIRGELWLTVADVELVFVGADLVIANPDTIRPVPPGEAAIGDGQ